MPDDPIPTGVDVDATSLHNVVPAEDFPITPTEAWLIMRGYWVKPKQPVNVDKLLTLPGQIEMRDGYIGLYNP